MIEPTEDMILAGALAIADADLAPNNGTPEEYADAVIRAVLPIIERDYDVILRLTAEQIAAYPKPRRRLRACVERWPGAEIEGDYDPRCCRFPKSCSATVYDDDKVSDADLEPEYRP